jgi:uncharacterized protein YdbL (DUF1318 family)
LKEDAVVRRLLFTLFLLVPLSAWATLTLDEAKQSGLVGEDASGYIAAVSSKPSKDVQALVADINAKRRTSYEGIVTANKGEVTLEAVEQLAGKKLIESSPAGYYVRVPGQGWRKK